MTTKEQTPLEAAKEWMENAVGIPGFDGYLASSDGRFFRTFFHNKHSRKKLDVPVEIAQAQSYRGYMRLSMTVKGVKKTYSAHRLILEAFSGPCPEGCEASHLNGVKTDNRSSNLVWETRSENHQRKVTHGTAQRGSKNPLALLNEQQVSEIKHALISGTKQRDIASRFNVSEYLISSIKCGKRWCHVAEPVRPAMKAVAQEALSNAAKEGM